MLLLSCIVAFVPYRSPIILNSVPLQGRQTIFDGVFSKKTATIRDDISQLRTQDTMHQIQIDTNNILEIAKNNEQDILIQANRETAFRAKTAADEAKSDADANKKATTASEASVAGILAAIPSRNMCL